MNNPVKKMNTKNLLKLAIATCLMLIFHIQVWSNTEPVHHPQFIEGTEVFVMAPSGLTLRAHPDMHSKSLGIVEYGSQLTIINQPDSTQHSQKINWVSGHWVKVEFEGVHGYMFDGYLSDLPMPTYDFKKCNLDLSLIYPIESWTALHLGVDTVQHIEHKTKTKTITHFETGDRMVATQKQNIHTMELYLTDTRLMDVYHLLQSMIEGKHNVKTFIDHSTFIEGDYGNLHMIKIHLDSPIRLQKMANGDIKVTIHAQDYICAQ